jgi:hypothetical protein
MVRVLTDTGLVDVTDDHSLLQSDGTAISPKHLSVGTELLHHPIDSRYPLNKYNECAIREDGCFVSDDWVYLSNIAVLAQQSGMRIRISVCDNLFYLETLKKEETRESKCNRFARYRIKDMSTT